MIRLHHDRLALLRKYLKDSQVNPVLFEELLDHLACEAEERLWDGAVFEEVLELIAKEANPQSMRELNADLKALLGDQQSLTDMVFEGRNKQYGAYDLRKGYVQTIQRSLVLGVAFFLMLVLLPDLYARLTPLMGDGAIGYELDLNRVDIKPTVFAVSEPPIPERHMEGNPEGIESTSFPNPKNGLTKNGLMENDMSDQYFPESLLETYSLVMPGDEKGWIDPNDWQRKPEFPGGTERLMGYIETEMRYPVQAVRNRIEGRVLVGFTINSQGKVQDVEVIEGIGYGCDQVAKDIVAAMPQWRPGSQSGKIASYRYILPISFELNK